MRSISSAKQSRGQKLCSVIQSDILGNFIDKDMHYERTPPRLNEVDIRKYVLSSRVTF